VGLILLTIGCTTAPKQYKTNLIQFLYPRESTVSNQRSDKLPTLVVPLKAGIAFVPANNDENFPDKEKMALMQKIASQFEQHAFLESIERIPSPYLEKEGGFLILDKLQQMLDIDVIMLLSYNQSQFRDTRAASIAYLTLVGAYIVKGEKNDTHTLMDAALFHIQSRKLLFRASGISHIKSNATLVNLTEQARKDSLTGFREASTDLVKKIQNRLYEFRKMIRSSSDKFKLKPGYKLQPLDSIK